MLGNIINSEGKSYEIIKEISIDRDNADIYLCQDENGNKFIIKYFVNITPRANIAYAKYNHYGRGRDGSEFVFNEIKEKNSQYDFLVKHYNRAQYNGSWLIIIEYIEGEQLREFCKNNFETNPEIVLKSLTALAKTLAKWHNKGFAHGDPHLENAIVKISEGECSVKLIDYSQLHHSSFHYCQQYDCFSSNPQRRVIEDLENEFYGKLGTGFRKDIISLQTELKIDNSLIEAFDHTYKQQINTN